MNPKSNLIIKCLYKRCTEERHSGGGRRESEIRALQPQAKEHLELPEAGRGKEDSPLEPLE